MRAHTGLLLSGMGIEATPALPVLLELQQSEDVQNRRLAALVLGSLGYDLAETVPPLHDALQDDDETVRHFAADALEEITPAHGRLKVA